MATRHLKVELSLTEVPHFRRFVEFLEEIEALADERDDTELAEMVENVRADLTKFSREW